MKKRKELREAIAKSANGIKSNIYLEISEIFRKALDDKEYAELSELQREKRYAIMDILNMESVDSVSCIATLTAGMRGIDLGGCR